MATTAVYQPSASQWAAAHSHLDNRVEHVRIDGIRWAVVTSANSSRVYRLPADASSCPCTWNTRTGTRCSHMLAVELAATLDELAEQPAPAAPLFPPCRVCGRPNDLGTICDECAARQERGDRLSAARRSVALEIVG